MTNKKSTRRDDDNKPKKRGASSRERGAGSNERGASSREQRAGGREQRAGSREQRAGSKEQRAGSREPRVGNRERGARSDERNEFKSFDKPKRRERGDPSWRELNERRAGSDKRGAGSREQREGSREKRSDRPERSAGRKEYSSKSRTSATKASPFDKFDIDKMREAKTASLEKKERRRPSRAGSNERGAGSRERGAGSNERGAGGRAQRVEKRETNVESKKPLSLSKGFDRKKPGDNEEIRLNRYIANSGVCSRRKADELIEKGQVTVNGEIIKELGYKVKYSDKVKFDGKLLKPGKLVYVLLNKPKDFITTLDDPLERRTVVELTSKLTNERIFPVGRLDRNTTGLLLLTNDGDLADKLSHPRNQVKKIYEVELDKSLHAKDFEKIKEGVELEDGPAKVDQISYLDGKSKKFVGVEIHIGRNRIVRRIFESLGYEVVKLDRVVYAGLTKKDLPRGRSRMLTKEELIYLKHLNKY